MGCDTSQLAACLHRAQEALGSICSTAETQTRWYTPAIPALEEWRQEDPKFKGELHTTSGSVWPTRDPVSEQGVMGTSIICAFSRHPQRDARLENSARRHQRGPSSADTHPHVKKVRRALDLKNRRLLSADTRDTNKTFHSFSRERTEG